jgi:fumarylacetoacetate (FAA) hydrolase family protein
VPPDEFTLEPGHLVEIEVPGIGILANPVVSAASIVERSLVHV